MSELAQHGDISSIEPAADLSGWKNIAGLTAAVLMAVVWLGAGLWKLTVISQFQLMLTQLLVPVSLSLPATIAVIIGDLTAGVLLLRPEWRRMGGVFSIVLLVIFMGYFAINYEALRGADCSCFPWVKRAVGPELFWSDGAMVALSLLAAWFAPRVGGLRRAAYVVAGIAAISMAALAVDKLGPAPAADVPATIAVEDGAFSLREGRVFVYFFNPMCLHCLDAGKTMATYEWTAAFVGVPTEEEDFAQGFVDDTGLKNVKLSSDADLLKETFPFQDPPYAVAIEDGVVKERMPFFEEPELGERLRELGFVK